MLHGVLSTIAVRACFLVCCALHNVFGLSGLLAACVVVFSAPRKRNGSFDTSDASVTFVTDGSAQGMSQGHDSPVFKQKNKPTNKHTWRVSLGDFT